VREEVTNDQGVRKVRIEDVNEEKTRCANCGWEGGMDDLVERQGDLLFYDQTMNLMYDMGITRWNLHCPVCAGVIKSVRKFPGEKRSVPIENRA
jgi:hypothetical protein